jgi:hypothetical protein
MRMTSRVIQETMRVASILSFTFREAVEDVEYQGEGCLYLAIRSLLVGGRRQRPCRAMNNCRVPPDRKGNEQD